jgi:hypothetical protein
MFKPTRVCGEDLSFSTAVTVFDRRLSGWHQKRHIVCKFCVSLPPVILLTSSPPFLPRVEMMAARFKTPRANWRDANVKNGP